MATQHITVRLAAAQDLHHIQTILQEIEAAAAAKGSGLCKRSPEQIAHQIHAGTAVVALTTEGRWAGFCYIKAWDNDAFVSTCALIVAPQYRRSNVATRLKEKAFALARATYPSAKLFGLTTSRAVMKINSRLRFMPVTYSEITKNKGFWEACKSCPNYNILLAKDKKACLCTAMLFDAAQRFAEQASSHNQTGGASPADETSLQKKIKKAGAIV